MRRDTIVKDNQTFKREKKEKIQSRYKHIPSGIIKSIVEMRDERTKKFRSGKNMFPSVNLRNEEKKKMRQKCSLGIHVSDGTDAAFGWYRADANGAADGFHAAGATPSIFVTVLCSTAIMLYRWYLLPFYATVVLYRWCVLPCYATASVTLLRLTLPPMLYRYGWCYRQCSSTVDATANAVLPLILVTVDVTVAGECEARFDRRVSGLEGGDGGD